MSFTSYSTYINSNESEKVILAHIHASRREYNLSIEDGYYSKFLDQFVTEVKVNDYSLAKVDTLIELDDNTKYYFNETTKKLYLYSYDQDLDEIIVTYRFFYSNVPIIASWDLTDDGEKVYYEPRINKTPQFKSNMSQGKNGINLVGSGDLTINNNDGYFDALYDTYFWENKNANIYSTHRSLADSESKLFFRGIITGKNYSTETVTFKLNDDLYALEQLVPSEQYDSLVIEEDSTNYKRVIYGKVNNLQVQSISKFGNDGLSLTGTLSGISGNRYITGSSTLFTSELSSGDKIFFDDFEVTVDEVKSDTIIKTSELQRTFSGQTADVVPEIQYYVKNRSFQVSGHSLKVVNTTIENIISRNRIEVSDSSNFESGDTISINGEEKTVRRVSGNTIVLTTNFNSDHTIGDSISKNEIYNIRYINDSNSINMSDVTITNSPIGTTFQLNNEAEINAANTLNLKQRCNFINNSSSIWLGYPARYQLSLPTTDMYGTYFIIYDIEGESTAYWFKDTAPESSSIYQEPSHGADNSISISLSVSNPDTSTLQDAIINSINANCDYYFASSDSDYVILESVNSENLSSPSSETSGVSVTSLNTGSSISYKINLNDLVKPRDFIVCPDGISREVLEVYEKSIRLRSTFTGTTGMYELNYKNVDYISDDTVVYLNCYGKTKDNTTSGELIKTVPEVVQDILTDAGLSSYLDSESFSDSSIRSPQLVSMAIPYSLSDDMPTVKDVINKLNKSVIGSIFINSELNLGYDILDSEIPSNELETIRDNDVIKWSVSGDSFDIVKKVIGNYGFVDYKSLTKEEGSFQVSYSSDFVTKYIGNENTKEVDLYLYKESDAQEIVERDQFINSLSNSRIKVQGSLNLSKFNLGQRVLLDFQRLYIALGGSTNTQRVGVISSIKQTGEKVELEIEDIGSLYTRSARITADSASDYSDSTNKEKVINSFIVNDNEIIDTNEETYSTNLIS